MLVFRGLNNMIWTENPASLGLYITIGTGSSLILLPILCRIFGYRRFAAITEQTGILNATMLVAGLLLSAVYVLYAIFNRKSKQLRGYEVPPLRVVVGKTAAFFIVINLFSYWLAMDDGLPIMLILLAALYAIYTFIATKTIPGRHLYAMGGNIKAAELSGVNTRKMMFFVYANMGFLAGIAAVVTAGRSMSSSPNVGVNFELDAIGACFIGGASAYGGIGTIWGAVVGAFIMGVMNNGMSMIGFDVFLQSVAKGLVVLLAVAFDMYSKSKSRLS